VKLKQIHTKVHSMNSRVSERSRKLKPYNDVLRDIARAKSAPLADINQAMAKQYAADPAVRLTYDGERFGHQGAILRERLLGDAVPDVPITVDAQLPDEPDKTLRHRMRVTREKYCWKCHQKMDPLGMPFEMYNHFGLYRTQEHDRPHPRNRVQETGCGVVWLCPLRLGGGRDGAI
jgi:hypothetical protein